MSRVVYGSHPVRELIRSRARDVRELIVASRKEASEIVEIAEKSNIAIRKTGLEDLRLLTGDANHQGVVALVGPYPYRDLGQLIDEQTGTPLVLALDGVTDPQNLGAIFRSALVLGATGIVLPKDRAAAVNDTVVRVSAGATEHLPCAQVTNLRRALQELKESGLWIAGTLESNGSHPADVDLAVPLAVVLGSEGKGIRPLIRRTCDLMLNIPSAAKVASLNVAAATAAILYEVSRQRR